MAKPTNGVAVSTLAVAPDGVRVSDARVAQRVYRELLDLLVTEIAPGSKVSIDGMSRRLGVSQTPVREVLARLESEGLVVRTHLAGFRSQSMLTREQLDQIFQMRMLMEPFAAKVAASRHTSEQAAEMRRAADRVRVQASGSEPVMGREFPSADACLHDLIATAAGNPLLRDAITKLHVHVHLYRVRCDARVSVEAIAEHDAILTAIANRKPQAAARAMRSHLRASYGRLGSVLRRV